MILKILIRVFFACVAIAAIAVVAIVTCVWMATQPPSFYQQLLDQQYSVAETKNAETYFEEIVESIEMPHGMPAWLAEMKKSGRPNVADPSAVSALLEPLLAQPDHQDNTRQIEIQQDRVNALLAGTRFPGGEIKDVRIQFAEDRVRIAGKLENGGSPTVFLSADVRLNMTPGGDLQVDLLGARIGQLAFPLVAFLRLIEDELNNNADNLQFNLDAQPANLTFNLETNEELRLDEISLAQGKMMLKLSGTLIGIQNRLAK